MRTVLTVNTRLLDSVTTLSGAKTKKEAAEIAIKEFIRRKKALKLLGLEGKIEFSRSAEELVALRRKEAPCR